MKIIIAGDKGSGKTTLARLLLHNRQWIYMTNYKDFRYVDKTWTLFVDNTSITQEFIDVLEGIPNDAVVTTINFNTDDVKTTIPVFALQQIPRYRVQPQDQILEMVS